MIRPPCAERAAELIKRGCDTVDGAVIWIDGFSGFTETELLMIKALSGQCAELNFCLFSDSDRNLIFSCPDRTCSDIIRIMTACGHRVKVENLQEKRGGSGGYQIPYENTRFAGCPAIGKIEESYGRIKKSTKSTSADISCDGVAVFRCTDIYREIENCADEIINLAAGGMKFSDIAVVSPNVDENAALFRAVFAKLKIPFFIDTKRDLSGHPVVRYILSFIDIVADDMPVKAVFTLLKTGLYKAEEYSPECIDLLENAAAASGAVNSAGWRRMCEKLASKYEKKRFADCSAAPYGECLPPYAKTCA